MGGHSSTTENRITHNNTQNVDQTNNNTYNKNQQFHVDRTVNTNVSGNVVDGRSVIKQNTANAGLECYGMVAGDPRCKVALILLI